MKSNINQQQFKFIKNETHRNEKDAKALLQHKFKDLVA